MFGSRTSAFGGSSKGDECLLVGFLNLWITSAAQIMRTPDYDRVRLLEVGRDGRDEEAMCCEASTQRSPPECTAEDAMISLSFRSECKVLELDHVAKSRAKDCANVQLDLGVLFWLPSRILPSRAFHFAARIKLER